MDPGAGRVTTARFPLPEPPPFAVADDARLWPYQPGLAEELDRREREGQRLLGNFFGQLAQTEHHENWRGLYRLPPRRINELRQTRLALRSRHPLGFAAYELPGELSGSALLAHPAALQPYARAIVARANTDGLWSLELRGSPHKYRPADPLGWLAEFQSAMTMALREAGSALRWGFILIADRRQRDRVAAVVNLACDARERLGEAVLGCDLAGDEGTARPEELAPAFERAFDSCLPLTIHAGEGEAADRIWQAAYRLHADRIGHGLTLLERPELLEKFLL